MPWVDVRFPVRRLENRLSNARVKADTLQKYRKFENLFRSWLILSGCQCIVSEESLDGLLCEYALTMRYKSELSMTLSALRFFYPSVS